MRYFNPHAWFWYVGDDTSRAWSSAAGAYVPASEIPQGHMVTRISSEQELSDVLRPYGLKIPVPVQADYSAAIQKHVDGIAQSKGYSDGHGLATYAVSSVSAWVAEAQTFVAWRDAVWVYAYAELAKVQNGQRAQPTIEQILSELPSITWP